MCSRWKPVVALIVFFVSFVGSENLRGAEPQTICYSVAPNSYLDAHAAEIKKIYDGFFFVVGSWENLTQRFVGDDVTPPQDQSWLQAVRRNIASLRAAGVTENLMGVSFNADGAWPSPNKLLGKDYARKMEREFSTLGRVAKDLGFRGVSIDVEYPYPRYEVTNPLYRYNNYTVEDLLTAARSEGRRSLAALLDQFPDAVVMVLPGSPRSRPIDQAFILGMLQTMVERKAPGGFHFGSEYTYCLADRVTDLAGSRFADTMIGSLTDAETVAYWRRYCSVAAGVWPLHMVETGGEDYPLQPWAKEVAELRAQMADLRAVAKRYVWVFSGDPSWYVYSPELEKSYGLKKQQFIRGDIDLRLWHQLLADKPSLEPSSKLAPLVDAVRKFDSGQIDAEALCDAFGTPGRWWVLGILGSPRKQPQFLPATMLNRPIHTQDVFDGRDDAVRWFAYDDFDPRGQVDLRHFFNFQNTDDAAAYLSTYVETTRTTSAYLNLGWDDGLTVQLGGRTVFDVAPPSGHGVLFRDKYRFEKRVPINLPAGRTRLNVVSVNYWGTWEFTLRITDEDGMPIPDVKLRLQ